MSDLNHEGDVDIETRKEWETWWFGPAHDHVFLGALDGLISPEANAFASFLPADPMAQLERAGIAIREGDANRLGCALSAFHDLPNLHVEPQRLRREERIKQLADELSELLSEDDRQGVRLVWGEADAADEDPEPEATLDIADLRADLNYLARSAEEQLAWLNSARMSAIQPGNRADRRRYFYWLILIAFWEYQLERAVATSTAEGSEAYGPLIRFIQIMSAGMDASELNGDLIRSFVRRSSNRISYFSRWFCPLRKTLEPPNSTPTFGD